MDTVALLKTVALILFSVISAVMGILFLRRAYKVYKGGEKAKRVLTATQVYTMGVFVSVVLMFIPIYYTSYDFGDTCYLFRPLLIAVHNSLRIFILDGDFDIIVDSLSDQHIVLRVCFLSYAAFLYVVAPLLTFGNVLSLFKNVKGEVRFNCTKSKKLYIMSELNEKSIALAESLYAKKENAVIVFTDVFEQNEEDDYEILTRARDMNAICLKKDISHLDFVSKKGDVEIFLIGNDESENVSQAVKITRELNENQSKYNVKVFVFSSKPSAAYIIDSIRYDHLLQHASENDYGEACFKLRRIDEKRQLIWNTVPKMKLFELADRNEKTLSVLIAGFGSYGMEFFKMLVWYCQFEGYKLQINIVDKCGDREKKKDHIQSLINRACPELLEFNCSTTDGDAQYDIETFSGVDLLTDDFDQLLFYDGPDKETRAKAARLKATNLAFVSLGDDDVNIEVSVHLRSLFDRVNNITATEETTWDEEIVHIYSVVFDDHKSRILYNAHSGDEESKSKAKEPHLLRNHQNVPYHIHFIGGMSSQFHYDNIYDAKLEERALKHHTGWVIIDVKEGPARDEAMERERKKYEQYEYYRLSSMAKELYQRAVESMQTGLKETNRPEEDKTQPNQNERSEHMRWNAYTRVIGFSYNEVRADRAWLHDKLYGSDKLTKEDIKKDAFLPE